MRLVLRQRRQERLFYGLIYGAITICALAAARFLPVLDLLPSCPFRGATGIACPTCGSSRALTQLAQGSVLAALSLNPLLVLAVFSALAWLVFDVVQLLSRSSAVSLELSRSEGTVLRVCVIVLFLANWAFLVLHRLSL